MPTELPEGDAALPGAAWWRFSAELQTSTAMESSILPSLSCHTQSSSAQFFCGTMVGSEARNWAKLKLPQRGKIVLVSFNLDQFSRPAACADRWEQGKLVPADFN